MDPKGLFVIAAGVFSICGALFNWDWFMNHRKAQFFSRVLGRQGARVFYGALGTAIAVVGGAISLGVIK